MPHTHEQWIDPNAPTRQHVPVAHEGHRRHCVDGLCRAFHNGYQLGILHALQVERAFRAGQDA